MVSLELLSVYGRAGTYKRPYSVDNVLRIAEVIVTLEINLPESRQTVTRTLYTSKEERDIAYLIETDDWLTSNG